MNTDREFAEKRASFHWAMTNLFCVAGLIASYIDHTWVAATFFVFAAIEGVDALYWSNRLR